MTTPCPWPDLETKELTELTGVAGGIDAESVLELVRLLESHGILVWLDGGWGVDALLGEQTRLHEDVDIVLQEKDLPLLRRLLEERGYRDVPRDDTRPWNFVLGEPAGLLVDVHAFVFDSQGNGIYGPAVNGYQYSALTTDISGKWTSKFNDNKTEVEAVRKELKLPGLRTKLTPVTSQNRIPLVQNGTVDLECGSTTNNLERQQQVAFSSTLFVVGTRLLARKDSGVRDFPDLAGKNVVTTAGTTSERLLRRMNDEKRMRMSDPSYYVRSEDEMRADYPRYPAIRVMLFLYFLQQTRLIILDPFQVDGGDVGPITGDHAVVRGAYTMRVRIKGQQLALQGNETILLRREAGGWRITGGL